jgi:hypothetical protein
MTVTLYRPVGRGELELIQASGMRVFPPRLADQPIFYPVLKLEYARQIARDWNTKDERSGFAGYVLRFEIAEKFVARYKIQRAGSDRHLEYWIPAEELEEFNRNIVGEIQVIERYED